MEWKNIGGVRKKTDCRLISETENKTNANITQICIQSERKILQLLRLIQSPPAISIPHQIILQGYHHHHPEPLVEAPLKKPRVCAKKQSQMESVQGANSSDSTKNNINNSAKLAKQLNNRLAFRSCRRKCRENGFADFFGWGLVMWGGRAFRLGFGLGLVFGIRIGSGQWAATDHRAQVVVTPRWGG